MNEEKTFSREQLAEATRKALAAKEAKYQAELLALRQKAENLEKELLPIREKERERKIIKTVEGLTDQPKLLDAIKLANISKEDDEEKIKLKVQKVIDERDWLKPKITDPSTQQELTKQQSVKPKKENNDADEMKNYKFVKL